MGLLRDTLEIDAGLAGIQLGTAWEGIQWLHAEFKTLDVTFDRKKFVSSGQVTSLIVAYLFSVNNKIVDIENVVLKEMARFNYTLSVPEGSLCLQVKH